MDMGICPFCNQLKPLLQHHTSYEPEKTTGICTECHLKLKKGKLSSSRGLHIGKIYPTTNQAYIPKDARRELGSLFELITGTNLVVMIKHNMPLEDTKKSLQIILANIKFRKEMEQKKRAEK